MSDNVYAIITAGGTGSRMKSDVPKQYMDVAGVPMIAHVLCAFEKSDADHIIVVSDDSYTDLINEIVEKNKISKFDSFASNGAERVFSVKNGLDRIPDDDDYVLIHDAARPMITPELINVCIDEVKKHNACVVCIPVKDTVKVAESDVVCETPDRSRLFAAQTPQCFKVKVLREAYKSWGDEDGDFLPTDDASLVERYSEVPVHVVQGDERNIKVTTPEDLKIASIFLREG